MALRHFLTLNDLNSAEAKQLIARASELKALHRQGKGPRFEAKVLGMIFEKSSTRTRVSFEAAMAHFGGAAIFLSPRDTQLGRGEPIEDAAKVLSSMLDMIMIRTFEHNKLETFARFSSVPVINGLSDDFHPCQLLADMQTYYEHRGDISGKTVAWIGDGNNMCQSYMNAARLFDFKLNIACPAGYQPKPELIEGNAYIELFEDPAEAAKHSSLLVTDVWASMGQEEQQGTRLQAFKNYQVNHTLMKQANKEAVFMHCLPAHRGEEVSAELMNDACALVWDEAENRLHAQKALMELLFKASLA